MSLLLFLALALALAAPEDPPAYDGATTVDDVRGVFERVERLQGLTIEREGSVVHLSGTVDSVRARDEARELASSIDDVLFVDERLVVATAPSEDAPVQDQDAELERRLKAIFARVTPFSGLDADVSDGVVHLNGTVESNASHDRVVELVKGIDGVVYVDDSDIGVQTDVARRLAPAVDEAWELTTGLLARLPLLLIGLLVIGVATVAGRWIGARLADWQRISDRPLVRTTLGRVTRLVVILIGVVFALELLDATGLVGAVLGAAGVLGLAVGFAFQDIVENYLAGVLLAVQQPFGQDDLIEVDGVRGVVVRLTTRNTLLMSGDGNHVFLPNAAVFKSRLTNFSRNPHRRFDFEVGVGVEESLPDVFSVGLETLRAMPGVTDRPAPSIRIEALGDSSVIVHIYGWVDQRTHDFLAVRTEAIRRIKEAYDEAGFDLPEPIYRVMMTQPGAPRPAAPRPAESGTVVALAPDDELSEQVETERKREPSADLLDGPAI